MGRQKKFTDSKKETFINRIANGETITNICKAMGIDSSTYRRARLADPEFAQAVDEAKKMRLHLVEDALFQSAINGNVLAQKFYLVNRGGGEWREMHYVTQDSKSEVTVRYDETAAKKIITDEESRKLFSQLFERILLSQDDAAGSDEAGDGE